MRRFYFFVFLIMLLLFSQTVLAISPKRIYDEGSSSTVMIKTVVKATAIFKKPVLSFDSSILGSSLKEGSQDMFVPVEQDYSRASGFIINPQGYIITNSHAILVENTSRDLVLKFGLLNKSAKILEQIGGKITCVDYKDKKTCESKNCMWESTSFLGINIEECSEKGCNIHKDKTSCENDTKCKWYSSLVSDMCSNKSCYDYQNQAECETNQKPKCLWDTNLKSCRTDYNANTNEITSSNLGPYLLKYAKFTNIKIENYVLFSNVLSASLGKKEELAKVIKKVDVFEKYEKDKTYGHDIALLKIKTSNLPSVKFGNSDKVKIGDRVYVVGFPGPVAFNPLISTNYTLEPSITAGIVSAKRKTSDNTDVLQTDASITHGNSGGPVFSDKNEVIGLATFGSVSSGLFGGEVQGFNFLIPVNEIKEFLADTGVKNIPSRNPIIDILDENINIIVAVAVVIVVSSITYALIQRRKESQSSESDEYERLKLKYR